MLEQSKTTKEIDEAILALQSKVPIIKKGTANDYYRSKYAEYPDIQTAIRPHLIEAKLLVKFFPVEGNKIVFILTHLTSQEFYKATIDLNSINATPQAQGSAISYMKRYAVVAAFDLIIEGDDDDGNAGSGKNAQAPAAATQQQKPNDKAPAPPANLAWLNPNTKDWFNQKWLIFNKGKNIDDIRKKYKVNKTNATTLIKTEEVKPGTVYWQLAVEYLAKDGSKIENITNMFTFSETDLQDLQIDATDYTPATDEATTTATNETTT